MQECTNAGMKCQEWTEPCTHAFVHSCIFMPVLPARLRSRSVLTAGDGGFGGLKADPGVRAVAERFGRRSAAPAKRERALRDLIFPAVPVEHLHIVALDQIRAVLSHLDGRHSFYLLR